MDLKTKQWYRAESMFDDEIFWYNYIFEIGNVVRYLTVESDFSDVDYMGESQEDFQDNILDSFELEETELSRDSIHKVVEGIFT